MLDQVFGNASKIDAAEVQNEFAQVLAPGEKVEHADQLIRDYFVFTDKRLVLVDKQGLTGSKVEYHSIPYKSISHFSVETGGHFDLDAETEDLDFQQSDPGPKKIQQEAKHLRSAVGTGKLRSPLDKTNSQRRNAEDAEGRREKQNLYGCVVDTSMDGSAPAEYRHISRIVLRDPKRVLRVLRT